MEERDWPWSELQLDPTTDVRVIRSAYARALKQSRPDQDALAYQRLREAYDYALEWAPCLMRDDDAGTDDEAADWSASAWQPQPYAEVVVRVDDGLLAPALEQNLPAEAEQSTPQPDADTYVEQSDARQVLEDLLARCEGPGDAQLAPLIAAALQDLPLDQENDAAVLTAHWVLAHPGAPAAVLSLLAQRFDWTRDFRIGSRLDASEVAELRELTSGVAIGAGQWRNEVRPLGPEHQQAWAFCGLMMTHPRLAWLLALLWPNSLLQKLRNWRGFALALTPELCEQAVLRIQACEVARWVFMALGAAAVMSFHRSPEGIRLHFPPDGVDGWNVVVAILVLMAGALSCSRELHRLPEAMVRPVVRRMMRAELLWRWREWVGLGGCLLLFMGVMGVRKDELSALYFILLMAGASAAVWGLFFAEGEEFLVRTMLWVLLCVGFIGRHQFCTIDGLGLAAAAGITMSIYLIVSLPLREKLEPLLFSPPDPEADLVRTNIVGLIAYAMLVLPAMPIMEARRGQSAVALRFMLVALCWSMLTGTSPYWPLLILWLPARIARPMLEKLGWKLVRNRLRQSPR